MADMAGGATASTGSSASATPSAAKSSAPAASSGSAAAGGSKTSTAAPAPGATAPVKAQAKGGEWNPGGQSDQPTDAQPAPRELGDGDMDAIVRLKINGEEKKMPLREAIKLSQLENASQERLRQAAEERKKIEAERQQTRAEIERYKKLEKMLETDVEGFFRETGKNFDDLAEAHLAKKFDLAMMTPDQRRAHEAEQRALEVQKQLDQYRQIEQSSKAEVLTGIKDILGDKVPAGLENASKEQLNQYLSQLQQGMNQHRETIQKEFIESWDQTGLPKHPWFMAQAVSLMLRSQKNGGEVLKTAEAADIVKRDFGKFVSEVAGQMDAKAIRELIGEAGLAKLKEDEIERVTQQRASQIAKNQSPGATSASGRRETHAKVYNQAEYRKAMGIR